MYAPLHKKPCDFMALSRDPSWWALLACLRLQKPGCCGMQGKDGCQLYQTCLFVGNFAFCIFFPLHIRAEVCFKIAFIFVMHDGTGCTQSRKSFQLQLPESSPWQQRREGSGPVLVLTPLGSWVQKVGGFNSQVSMGTGTTHFIQ